MEQAISSWLFSLHSLFWAFGSFWNINRLKQTITVANQEKVQEAIQTALDQFCLEIDMITINSTNAGDNLTIVYEVELKSDADDFQITSYLTQNIDQCDVALTKKAKKRKNL